MFKIGKPKSYKYRKYNYNTFLNLNKISAFLDKKCVKKKEPTHLQIYLRKIFLNNIPHNFIYDYVNIIQLQITKQL